MGNLVFQATLGGQVNLVGPNTASTYNLNVPAVAGTLVTTGDTGTVTNTMCATSVYTAPGTIGSGTPNTGAFTTLTTSSTVTHNGGTANGVAYLNASKVLTTGSALTFDGSNLTTTAGFLKAVNGAGSNLLRLNQTGTSNGLYVSTDASFNTIYNASGAAGYAHIWQSGDVEQMRLTSTGLGIGTSSPSYKLDVTGTARVSSTLQAQTLLVPVQAGYTSLYGYKTTGVVYGYQSYYPFDGGASQYTYRVGSGYGPTGFSFAISNSQTYGTDPALATYTQVALFDTSGNLGLGVTPSAWASFTGLQVGPLGGANIAGSIDDSFFGGNCYYNAGFKFAYASPAYATAYRQITGQHRWYTSTATGTAGNAATMTQLMTLDANGLLQVGLTSNTGGGRVDVLANATSAYVARSTSTTGANGGTSVTSVRTVDSSASYWANAQYDAWQHIFRISGTTEAVRIDSSGNLGLGTASPSASAILDAQSTTKGVRFPNMTTTQKNAISSPAAGLVVFDTTLAKLCVYSGSAWQTITSV